MTGSGNGFADYYSYSFGPADRKSSPDLVAALTYATGPFSAKLSGAYVNSGAFHVGDSTLISGDNTDPLNPAVYNYSLDAKSGYAVQLGVEVALDNISKGDKFGIQGVYADNAPAYTGWQKFYGANTALWNGTIYGGFASYIHYWNPSLWTAAEVSYLHHDGDNNFDGNFGDANLWQVSASTDWAIVKNLDIMLDGSYAHTNNDFAGDDGHQWSVNLWMKRSW